MIDMIDKEIVRKHFSRNAVNYDAYAKVQKKMAGELLKIIQLRLDRTVVTPKILDIGCGTGYLTGQLIELYPQSNITAIDLAPGMIELAAGKLAQNRINFICGDIEELEFDQKYDLIVANAAFQWLNQLSKTLGKLCGLLNEDGAVVFATFGSETFRELHHSFEMAKKTLGVAMDVLPGQRFPSYSEWERICRESAGPLGNQYSFTGQELFECEYFESVRAFFQSVKKTGANNSNRKRHGHPALTRETMRIYEEQFQVDGRIGATYHCIYIAVKKEGKIS
jgi:malonyl-CoA O-methyltransferase